MKKNKTLNKDKLNTCNGVSGSGSSTSSSLTKNKINRNNSKTIKKEKQK